EKRQYARHILLNEIGIEKQEKLKNSSVLYNPQNEMYTNLKRNVHFLVGCRHSKDRQKPSQLRAFLLHI
ncbi:hypothetical protein, partial [Ornithobacterium rhinotracheale]